MIIVITGLILAGKSTLSKFLIDWGYKPVLEYTTRPMREGEKDGEDYHFVDDETFDKMNAKDEFAETLFIETVFGLWKYGARKEDMKNEYILVCGPTQMEQLLNAGVPMLSVLLDIDKETAQKRAAKRGDNLEEFERRFRSDEINVNRIRDRMDMILDATNMVEVNARMIDNRHSLEIKRGYMRTVENQKVYTAQEISDGDVSLYLEGNDGIRPYLRMRKQGMPDNPINQIAWLLLNGSGCGFCKVCRDKPCNIKDGEKCTINIADYIRECVHAEDVAKNKENENE